MRLTTLLVTGAVGLTLAATAGAQTAGMATSVEENYKATCQPCHMADGNAALETMNFADGKWKHGTDPHALAKVIANGVPGTAMMPFKARFSEQEILALAKYVRRFDPKLKGAPAAAAKRKPAAAR